MLDNATASTALPSDGTLRLSSRGLGWGPVKMERRDVPPGRYALPRGMHKHQLFVSLSSGRVHRERDGSIDQIDAQPGTVVLQPAHGAATWRVETRLSFVLLLLDPDLVERTAHSYPGETFVDAALQAAKRDSDPVISNIIGLLSQELTGPQAGSGIYVESLARVLAVHLLRHYGSIASTASAVSRRIDGSIPPAVGRAMRYLQSHFAEEVTLDELARAACCSPFYLSRRFKQATGMTPFQYLLQLRVDHARHLVSAGAGERSLADVARAAGFADQSHLTRQMKRVLGVTPGMLRVA